MPVPCVHLVYGSDSVKVHQERSQLISRLLPAEHRPENLTEVEPPTGRTLSLAKIAADLMSELGTPSFFPEFPRVIVVEQLAEFFGKTRGQGSKAAAAKKAAKGKAKKAGDPVAAFCRYLERDLAQTGNALILVAIEEPEKMRRVSTSTKLFKTVREQGRVSQHKEPAAIFALIDAFSARNLPAAMKSLDEVMSRDDGAPSVYRLLTRQVRFLIQAKLLQKQARGDTEAFAAENFPQEKGLNLLMEPGFVTDKVRRMAPRWTLGELNSLLGRLERLTKVVYPSGNDIYVPDVRTELELMLIEACKPS